MIAIPLPLKESQWTTMSFASTLYLCPILDLLLAKIPPKWRPEIRLGLQEALVNAAKHGNKLDPAKTIVVKFIATSNSYSWVISDQGSGFSPSCECLKHQDPSDLLPVDESENGRGMCLLHQIFDRVDWYCGGRQLKLCKFINK